MCVGMSLNPSSENGVKIEAHNSEGNGSSFGVEIIRDPNDGIVNLRFVPQQPIGRQSRLSYSNHALSTKVESNEPQRPKSALEHFVRETEQTMRSENAAASDADIRQVAESMWEALDPDHKQNYLNRVEEEKREYLKQLLEWRAQNSLPPLNSERPILCTRRGCTAQAAENPRWDHEFCSDQCCLAYTREYFEAWLERRTA